MLNTYLRENELVTITDVVRFFNSLDGDLDFLVTIVDANGEDCGVVGKAVGEGRYAFAPDENDLG